VLVIKEDGEKSGTLVLEVAISRGRITLLNFVLPGISVYWLSLAKIPTWILNQLRKVMINFLWACNSSKHKMHLTRWESISLPKRKGGWGIKNLMWFRTTLRLKTFWRGIQHGGIWRKVLLAKYLKGITLEEWARQPYRRVYNASIF